jgi:restriction endonuclease Mrr
LKQSEAPELREFLTEILRQTDPRTVVYISRKEVIRVLSTIAKQEEAPLLFEDWEKKLRTPVAVGQWTVRYSAYSDSLVAELTPDWGQIERAIDIRTQDLQRQLRETITFLSPAAFTQFLANLFSRVTWATQVSITKLTHDGGIDFSGFYLYPDKEKARLFGQAKHWKDKHVGSPEIRNFIGSVVASARGKPCVGVFVSTGGFTSEAILDIRENAPFKLLKFDSSDLVKLMTDFKVGVKSAKFEVEMLDDSFWNEISS